MYEPADIGIMPPLAKTLDEFLLKMGLEKRETSRMDLTKVKFSGLYINRLVYVNSNTGERIFIEMQEKPGQ